MTADTLRRLQALRGLTRTGSTHTVLAAVQGDLQTVIEAVLDLAGHDDEPATDEPAVGEQVTDCGGGVWQRFEDGWRWWMEGSGAWSHYPRTWDYVQTIFGPLRATTDDDRRRVGLPVRDENTPPASQNPHRGDAMTETHWTDAETARAIYADDVMNAARLIAGCVEDDDDCATHEPCAWPCQSQAVERIARLFADRERAAAARALREAAAEAESDAEKCPCHTTRCREANRTTARWLRDRADALEAGEDRG